MTVERYPFPWIRVIAIAVGFALIDELVIVPLFTSVFGLTSLDVPIVQRIGWAVVAAFIVAGALAFVAGRVRANVEQLFVAFFVILAGLRFAARAQAAYFFAALLRKSKLAPSAPTRRFVTDRSRTTLVDQARSFD